MRAVMAYELRDQDHAHSIPLQNIRYQPNRRMAASGRVPPDAADHDC
jgi:hypothetical protein